MANGIEINDDLVAGLVPVLKDPETFATLHTRAERYNRVLHLTHLAMVAGLTDTQYERPIIDAANVGAMAYEALGANTGEPVPAEFVLQIIAERSKDPNFGLHFAEQMDEARRELEMKCPYLAQGLLDLCLAQIKDPGLAATYGLGGAAVMRAAHADINHWWRLEKQFLS